MLQTLAIASDIAGAKLGSAKGVTLLCDYITQQGLAKLEISNYLIPTYENLAPPSKNAKAKYIALLYEFYVQQVIKSLESILRNNDFPLILSGDHASALACVQGIQNVMPNQNIGIIWIDAHADIHTPSSSPSGNIHGMPLAALIGSKAKHIDSLESLYWQKLTSLSKVSINPKNIAYCGLRSFESSEKAIIDTHQICVCDVENLKNNLHSCVGMLEMALMSCEKIYVSIDVDVLDSNEFQSTGCNVDCGISWQDLKNLVALILKVFQKRIVAFEISEFNPILPNSRVQDAEMMKEFLHFSTDILQQLDK